jgi:signal transduction histidine kinase
MAPPRPVLLRAVVESAVDETARKRVTIDPGPWPEVDGDEPLLVLALHHLILNALEAGGAEGAVRVSAEPRESDTVALVIRDAGTGFKTRNPNAIVRLMSTTKGGHAGIGLMVAQRVARLHDGALNFETTPEGGVVRFILPRARLG